MNEKTLILCKPDAIERNLVGKILRTYEEKGLQLKALKMLQISKEQAKKHYAEHENRDFFQDLIEYITSSPVIALILEGRNAIQSARTINGATDPLNAAPGSIRGDYALNKRFNLVHASDSPESAKREINIFFNENEIFSYNLPLGKWL